MFLCPQKNGLCRSNNILRLINGMVATGNHIYCDSLRGAPPSTGRLLCSAYKIRQIGIYHTVSIIYVGEGLDPPTQCNVSYSL